MNENLVKIFFINLCSRLPYNVYVDRLGIPHKLIGVNSADKTVTINNKDYMPTTFFINTSKIPVKPYLRQMSSMTEEEMKDYRMFIDYSYNDFTSESTPCVYTNKVNDYIDWLNEHHFDYRGLIEKGLAIEAPKGMYGKI